MASRKKPLVNDKSFSKYVSNNTDLTKCEKKFIVSTCKDYKPFDFAKNTWIKSYYNSIKSNTAEKARFDLLIQHFTMKPIHALLQSNDEQIVDFIKRHQHHQYTNKDVCKKWVYVIEGICKFIKTMNISNIKYLDVGCGDARKTKIFHTSLNLPLKNTYCTDIASWGTYSQDKSKIPFQFELIKDNKLNYNGEHFDIVSCILTLHHVPDLSKFIKEICRILKRNGLLILIEHSTFTKYDKALIDIQHLLFGMLYDNRNDYIENPDYIKCYNMYVWDYIMSIHGFTKVLTQPIHFGNHFEITYDNMFFTIYKKTE